MLTAPWSAASRTLLWRSSCRTCIRAVCISLLLGAPLRARRPSTNSSPVISPLSSTSMASKSRSGCVSWISCSLRISWSSGFRSTALNSSRLTRPLPSSSACWKMLLSSMSSLRSLRTFDLCACFRLSSDALSVFSTTMPMMMFSRPNVVSRMKTTKKTKSEGWTASTGRATAEAQDSSVITCHRVYIDSSRFPKKSEQFDQSA
mmetsp:Transcript_4777/g.14099  ORF Transcript_4777/g.14099 Transcript_4777/m.14099 type:complete len:204 (+) Transcript_4777:266-877(+)